MRYKFKIFRSGKSIEIGETDSFKEGLAVLKENPGVIMFDKKKKRHSVFMDGKIRIIENLLRQEAKRKKERLDKKESEKDQSLMKKAQDSMQSIQSQINKFQEGIRGTQGDLVKGFHGEGGLAGDAFAAVFGRKTRRDKYTEDR